MDDSLGKKRRTYQTALGFSIGGVICDRSPAVSKALFTTLIKRFDDISDHVFSVCVVKDGPRGRSLSRALDHLDLRSSGPRLALPGLSRDSARKRDCRQRRGHGFQRIRILSLSHLTQRGAEV